MSQEQSLECTCRRRGVRCTHRQPTPPSPSDPEVRRLANGVGALAMARNEIVVDEFEVIADNELTEYEPFPDPPNPLWSEYYMVFKGRECGVFNSWDETHANTDGFSGNGHKKFTSFDVARVRWYEACVSGRVRGQVSPRSLFPFIVSREEIDRRVAQEIQRRHHKMIRERIRQLRAQQDREPSPPRNRTAGPSDAVQRYVGPAPGNHGGSRGDKTLPYLVAPAPAHPSSTAASNAPSIASPASPTLSASVSSITSASSIQSSPRFVPSSWPSTSHTQGEGSRGKGKGREEAAPVEGAGDPEESTGADGGEQWCVMRGVHPGIYSSFDECLLALGNNNRACWMPAPTKRYANDLMVRMAHFIEVLTPE
ncbi:hypothetical protein EIP86_008840 [Pleurotus ostreatoroseus]|nr:hypothetical protein EIP86_008840 [Pleurotus ostreatoroseus]